MLRRSTQAACKAQSCKRYFSVAPVLFKDLLDQSHHGVLVQANDGEFGASATPDVAVLGGGITGLASAYFTSWLYPKANITLFESSSRLGGWLRSDELNTNGGKVIFEQGPRSLRPAQGTLALISALGLAKDLLITPRSSAAAKNRYIYFQDRLVRVGPEAGLREMISEPLIESAFKEVLNTFFKQSRRASYDQDESIGDFFRRRGCPDLANNLVSAMMHGIYAGDIDELSVSAVLPGMTLLEKQFGSPLIYFTESLLAGFGLRPGTKLRDLEKSCIEKDYAWHIQGDISKTEQFLTTSIYTLKGGLQTLAKALIENLRNNPKVNVVLETAAESIGPTSNTVDTDKASLTVRKPNETDLRSYDFHQIISTIPATKLAEICPPLKNSLGTGTASTVCVVNLFYEEPNLTPVRGFGYLIPRATPRVNNPEGALGVVFDSDTTPALDTAQGTKLTVMLGGPFWKDVRKEQLPSNDEAIEMAKSVLSAHLGIKAQPTLAQANLQVNAIPQYTVGHIKRLAEARTTMLNGKEPWMQRVKVAGSSYRGVGVNDCISSAFYTARSMPYEGFFGTETSSLQYAWVDQRQYNRGLKFS